jgi:hypothetical protein
MNILKQHSTLKGTIEEAIEKGKKMLAEALIHIIKVYN